jgi:hypothetical protein
MPRGYRGVILAAVGWLILSGQHPNPPAEREQAKAQTSIAASLDNIASTYRQQAEGAKGSEKQTEPCDPPYSKRYSDLCAQWKAADAASDSAWWAAFAGWFGGLSFLGVLVALGLAFHSNCIARDTAKRQLRAYVSLLEINPDTIERNDGQFLELQIVWTNAGQTPALAVIANCNWQDFDGELPLDFNYPPNPKPDQVDPVPIGPGRILISRIPHIPEPIFRAVRQNKRRLFIWGWADYRDIFSTKRTKRTEFCYELRFDALIGTAKMAFIPYGPHNGLDGGAVNAVA